jgi:RNA polymerase sigma-70 factor (ECF subfamily)
MREITFSEFQRVQPAIAGADDTLQMDQDSFRALYERTARPLWAYLRRKVGDVQLADDLLQETYYRFLRAQVVFESDAHRKNYLFRIATNLANDTFRQCRDEQLPEAYEPPSPEDGHVAARNHQRRTDVASALARLKPRERDALWLAYAEGMSHGEIANALGVKLTSMKVLLFRARQKLASLLGDER